MGQVSRNQPVILLLDEAAAENSFIKQWFQKSRFLTCEATDVFQALEELSDFTVRSRPDVILLEINLLSEDFLVLREMFQTAPGEDELAIFALSETGKTVSQTVYVEGNLAQLEAKLNRMIPKHAKAA